MSEIQTGACACDERGHILGASGHCQWCHKSREQLEHEWMRAEIERLRADIERLDDTISSYPDSHICPACGGPCIGCACVRQQMKNLRSEIQRLREENERLRAELAALQQPQWYWDDRNLDAAVEPRDVGAYDDVGDIIELRPLHEFPTRWALVTPAGPQWFESQSEAEAARAAGGEDATS